MTLAIWVSALGGAAWFVIAAVTTFALCRAAALENVVTFEDVATVAEPSVSF